MLVIGHAAVRMRTSRWMSLPRTTGVYGKIVPTQHYDEGTGVGDDYSSARSHVPLYFSYGRL